MSLLQNVLDTMRAVLAEKLPAVPQLEIYMGDTAAQLAEKCKSAAQCCMIPAVEGGKARSANAAYRIGDIEAPVYFACAFAVAQARAPEKNHLAYIEEILSALTGARVDGHTVQGDEFKLVEKGAFLIYRINFNIK